MTNAQILAAAEAYARCGGGNCLLSEEAQQHGLMGLRLFDAPLAGFADAQDAMFPQLKQKGAVGPQFMTPEQWLPGARTVISLFLPFTREVRRSNYENSPVPSSAWLFGRIEGQEFVNDMGRHIAGLLKAEGYRALVPFLDPRFRAVRIPDGSAEGEWEGISFSSNWSERHVAYISGLGTFGLSKGLITEKGMAGRFTSVVTDAVLEPTPRAYTELYEYCIQCGACIPRCPVKAITLEAGKDHTKCFPFTRQMGVLYAPRYGCGKCQVRVPCESRIPKR